MNKVIYFDNNATTQVLDEVRDKMLPYFTQLYGNPSSIHSFGGKVALDIEDARRNVADLIGATYRNKYNVATEMIFTSCGTESNNAAIRSALATEAPRKKIVTSVVEHPAILALCKSLERDGYEVEYLKVDQHGCLNLDDVEKAVDENTAIVSVMWANNEIGNIYPVEKIAEIAHSKGALFHTDAVQAMGKLPINLANNQIDFLSFSGHKLHAPKGVGGLFVRRGVKFKPFLIGGHQERNRRGGTENVASIIGVGEACRIAKGKLESEYNHLLNLRNTLEQKISEKIPEILINGDLNSRLPNTSSISFKYIEGESILMLLDQLNICASSGSACTTGSLEPSHVLRAMGIPYIAAHGTIRFSCAASNTLEEVNFVAETLPDIIAKLREYSPYYNNK